MVSAKKLLSLVLAVVLCIVSVIPAYAGASYLEEANTLAEDGTEDSETVSSASDTARPMQDESLVSGEHQVPGETQENTDVYDQGQTEAPVWQDGVILLYTYAQLCAVGSGAPVMTGDGRQLGSGDMVCDAQGAAVVYGLDANYRLAQDIELPLGQLWQRPAGFSGRIAPADAPRERPVYDGERQAVLIYNFYQLETMAQENAAEQPILDGDGNGETFGVGSLLYPKGVTAGFLTYDPAQRYILSASFSSETPAVATVSPRSTTNDVWGRDFPGQVIKKINGKTYILIGNAEQLRAIGSNSEVYTAVYQAKKDNLLSEWKVDKGSDGNPIMLYGGDADLLQAQNGTQNYQFGKDGIQKAQGGFLEEVGRCGVNQETGKIDPNMDIEKSGQTYSSDANYIIFRDINLNDLNSNEQAGNWTPLIFSGTMIGAKAANGGKLWDKTQISASDHPVISNVRVLQSAPLDVGKTMGVGFFSTLHSETGKMTGATGAESFGSTGTTVVSGLILQSPVVHTSTTETTYEQTLINGLLSGLGEIVGGLLDGILSALGIHVDLKDILASLLNARKTDPTALATGALAGRVVGDVQITDCQVISPRVENVNASTGGFVGYAEGVTSYATEGIGAIVNLLSGILNGIPGLGLGDLITILLDNGLAVGKLVPTGYTAPQISDCHVTGLSGSLGNAKSAYAGGFIGLQIGTKITDCTVTGTDLAVLALRYGGGFSGLTRDAEIQGLLSNLGVELFRVYLPQSLLLNCKIAAGTVSVNGGEYLGGFVGALANSYAVNDSLTAATTVTGTDQTDPITTGSSIGGFAGIATTGWVTNLGAGENTNNGLLGNVGDLLTKLLSENPGQAQMLLSLAGVAPSAVMGCQINHGDAGTGKMVKVSGNDYVGGMLGKGDGVYLTPSASEKIAKLSPLQHMLNDKTALEQRANSLNGLTSVIAAGDYAGGIAGSLGAASVGGLLNNTIGVASFLGFTAETFSLSGGETGLRVQASRYAGGAFGEAVGGTVTDVAVQELANVQAGDDAGGFVGVCGPGDLVGTGGLTLNLLGLNNLLKMDSLLSVIPGVQVKLSGCSVIGTVTGAMVSATNGSSADTTITQGVAGGFAAYCGSAALTNCHVDQLCCVSAAEQQGYAGGFVGVSRTGGLADLANQDGKLQVGGELITVENLLGTIDYMIPTYTNCTVSYVSGGYVQADVAGGFVAELESGKVNNKTQEEGPYAVYHLDRVAGQTYAGGFGGIVHSGALADAGGGISILGGSGLSINLADLLSILAAYVPYVEYAGVQSKGFTVTADRVSDLDANAGSAGGFLGYASGAQISHCDVTALRHTAVTPPDELEAAAAPSYFGSASTYAVTGGSYAGGFIGCMDIGSAASVGGGLKVLGDAITLGDVLSTLSVVVTTIEHSDITGAGGGYAVLASSMNGTGAAGHAGGYAGGIYGGHVQNSSAHHFSYVIGQSSAGGYVGEMEPGDVARLLDKANILNNLVSMDTAMASVLQTFVPTIRNSSTDAVPCGGAVRAQAASAAAVQRGMAGGYVGHNMGGSIWGLNTDRWKTESAYTGPTSLCKAERIRSVYGAEYAGGYTGFLQAADTARAGGLKVLGGLISVNNILGALGVVYPTQENTAVYGPLANLDVATWNRWVEAVGQSGGYGYELAKTGTVSTPEELNARLAQYVYGTHTVAERGAAGGYVGQMCSGTLTNCMAYDVGQVRGYNAAGGYAGCMEAGGATEFGSMSILDLKLDVGKLVNLAELFVPAVKNSSVQGCSAGMTVTALGTHAPGKDVGHAGGFVGAAYGAQIQLNDGDLPGTWPTSGDDPPPSASCNVSNLRRVTGRGAVGGYVGVASSASLANVNTNASDGLLQQTLDRVLSSAGDLVRVLPATYTTIRKAAVSPVDDTWGFVVDGAYTHDGSTVDYAPYAGGFVGCLQAAVLGEKGQADQSLTVTGLRRVEGGLYAGGFVGLADVAAVAEVAGTNSEGTATNLLDQLLSLGRVDALGVLRGYIRRAGVTGVADGFVVQAHSEIHEGTLGETRYTGCAGGFAGGVHNGTLQSCTVSGLSTVQGLNYTGGFVGHMGKSGVVDVDSVEVLSKLLGATVGAIDLFGSQVQDSTVTGIPAGVVVKATGGAVPIAGGFCGYSDLGRIDKSTVSDLKKVTSDQIASGFIGKTDMAYLVSVEADSLLVQAVLKIVNELVKALYLGGQGLASIDLASLNLGILKVDVFTEGNTLKVKLLGLPITVALSKQSDNPGQQTDVAIVTIGDSVIRLPCDHTGLTSAGEKQLAEAEISLIKGNRTELDGCTVTGVRIGYDVFGGGADQDTDGNHDQGMAGGFVGYNHEGKISHSTMVLCDVVRGTAKKVGPFTGYNDLRSVYWFNDIAAIEGEDNHYSIYRPPDSALTAIWAAGQQISQIAAQETVNGARYNRYDITHINAFQGGLDTGKELAVYDLFKALEGAAETGEGVEARDLLAYVSDAKAMLMLDVNTTDNPPATVPEPGEHADPCAGTADLTIQKVWEDWHNVGQTRPESLSLIVYQQSFTPEGAASGEKTPYRTVDLTKENQESAWSAVWSAILTDAPVCEFADTNGNGTRDDGETITGYYVYTIEEKNVPAGYTVSCVVYDPSQAGGYELTVTNTLHLPLPDAGGLGDVLFVVVGVGLLLLALALDRHRPRRLARGTSRDRRAEEAPPLPQQETTQEESDREEKGRTK